MQNAASEAQLLNQIPVPIFLTWGKLCKPFTCLCLIASYSNRVSNDRT